MNCLHTCRQPRKGLDLLSPDVQARLYAAVRVAATKEDAESMWEAMPALAQAYVTAADQTIGRLALKQATEELDNRVSAG